MQGPNRSGALVDLRSATRVYDEGAPVRALAGVDLRIEPGELIAVVGPSGSGKSTLLHLLGLLDRPTGGTFHFEGRDVAGFDDEECSRVRNRRIGFVFQSFNLFPEMTVLENIEVPMLYAGTAAAERRARARELAERVGLGPRAGHRPAELSGGEMQRVAIARALANEPSMILADEPTGNLDTRTGREVLDLLLELHARGRTLVIVTHDAGIAALAPRRVRMRDGTAEEERR
jgi:putative ABC transport system ATP-binding protein